MNRPMIRRGFPVGRARAAALSLATWSTLAAGCGGGASAPTLASPSCYPACIASLLTECPLQGTCQGTVGATAASVCYSSGIKVQDQLISGPETVTVTNASGQPCYTVSETSAPGQAQRLFSVTVNGVVIARITDNKSSQSSATLYCGNSPTVITFPPPGADCQPLWWQDEQRCTTGTCP
jgi:hypothetical protein